MPEFPMTFAVAQYKHSRMTVRNCDGKTDFSMRHNNS